METAPFLKRFFSLLMEDGNVENFLWELNSFGYKSNVCKSISLIATVKKGYNKPFPVRDQTGKKIISHWKNERRSEWFTGERKTQMKEFVLNCSCRDLWKWMNIQRRWESLAKTMDLLFNKQIMYFPTTSSGMEGLARSLSGDFNTLYFLKGFLLYVCASFLHFYSILRIHKLFSPFVVDYFHFNPLLGSISLLERIILK